MNFNAKLIILNDFYFIPRIAEFSYATHSRVRYLDTIKPVLCYSSHSCDCPDATGMTFSVLEQY